MRPGATGGPTAAPSRELAVLLSLLEGLDVDLPREQALAKVLGGLLGALGGERAYLFRYDSRRDRVSQLHAHLAEGAAPELPVSESLVRKVAKEREALLVSGNVRGAGAAEAASLERLAGEHLHSIVVSPLERGRKLAGVLYLDSRHSRRRFTSADIELLASAASYLGQLVDGLEARDQLVAENRTLKAQAEEEAGSGVPLDRLHEPDSPMAQTLALIAKAAAKEVSLLLTGETGTGKEEAARFVHRRSPRRDGAFVPVNCAAIPEALVESELFGYQKGAFTGADADRPGMVELADGGTLFLDEIGELPHAAQVKLLRVLEERKVKRLGGGVEKPVDFRLVAATHRDLEARVASGDFRQDLLYRLKVFHVELPPLRARRVDLPRVTRYLLANLGPRVGSTVREVGAEALEVLESHPWPGNVRELRNVLERALVLQEQGPLAAESLPPELGVGRKGSPPSPSPSHPAPASAGLPPEAVEVRPYAEELAEFERDYLERLHRKEGDNVSAMARTAGLARLTLYRKLGKYALAGDPKAN